MNSFFSSGPRKPSIAQRLQHAWLARGVLVCALWPFSMVFGAITASRRAFYRLGVFRTHTLPVPVVVVGNLVAGGAGKTPTVMAIVRSLESNGYSPGIVSRGYGGNGKDLTAVQSDTRATVVGDEPLLMLLRTHAPVVVGRDRVAAAFLLLRSHPTVDVIVSDDGLQHLRLGRDAQVLVFDERGGGNGWLLPAGPLRERVPDTVPPRSVVVYNAVSASTPLPGTLALRALTGAVELQDWWDGTPASPESLEALRGRIVIAAAGIAQPERFFSMLQAEGLSISALPLPDHFDYTTLPWPATSSDVIVTEKDAIKLDPVRVGMTRIWVAPLDFALDAAFDAALLSLLPPPRKTADGNATP